MNTIDRFVLVLFRITSVWALGTPFEPLVTARPRVLPADDADIQPAYLAGIERHIAEAGRAFRNWFSWGIVLCLFDWVGTAGVRFWVDTLMLRAFAARRIPFEQYAAYREGVVLIWGLVLLVLLLIWTAWFVRFIRRSQADPSYEAADRLALALKRDSLGPDGLAVLRSHNPGATTLAYFGKLWPH